MQLPINQVGLYGPIQVSKPCKEYEMDLIEVFEGYKMNRITLFRWVCQNGVALESNYSYRGYVGYVASSFLLCSDVNNK